MQTLPAPLLWLSREKLNPQDFQIAQTMILEYSPSAHANVECNVRRDVRGYSRIVRHPSVTVPGPNGLQEATCVP